MDGMGHAAAQNLMSNDLATALPFFVHTLSMGFSEQSWHCLYIGGRTQIHLKSYSI